MTNGEGPPDTVMMDEKTEFTIWRHATDASQLPRTRQTECERNHTECVDMHIIALTPWKMMIIAMAKWRPISLEMQFILYVGKPGWLARRWQMASQKRRWKAEHIRDCRSRIWHIVFACSECAPHKSVSSNTILETRETKEGRKNARQTNKKKTKVP